MTEQEKINAERRELNTLISRGVNFDVERTVTVRKNIFSKPQKQTENLKFTIQEPTLAVLDLIAAEQIDLVIDEKVMSSEQGISEAKKLAHQHARRMARIVALAVMGEDYIIAEQKGARVSYRYDERRFRELAELFENNLKPSKLIHLTIIINQMANLGDFTNSIRLMSASRTTMPILVEEGKQD